jgi:hypothetical protein
MRLLFVIFVLCVAALIWTAFGVARHIRRHQLGSALPRDTTFSDEEIEVSAATVTEELMPTGPHKHS